MATVAWSTRGRAAQGELHMVLVKRMPGISWLALVAVLALCLVSTAVSSSHAQSSPGSTKVGIDGDDGLDTGDPDMPTGDTPPPNSGGTAPATDGGAYRGHATSDGITGAVPEKRFGLWAHWKIALHMLARGFIIR